MKSAARRTSLWALAAAAALVIGAGSVHASITFDPATDTGFVPREDARVYLGSTKAEEQKLATKTEFWYGIYHEEEYAVTCSGELSTQYIMYRTERDIRERVVRENGSVIGWKLLGPDGSPRTSVTNTLEWADFSGCSIELVTTYDFARLYVIDPFYGPLGAPPEVIWQEGEGVCFLASSGDPSAC